MTQVRRRESPFCLGCPGMNGWGACKHLRAVPHRHGDLPRQGEVCDLWVCQGCRKPSRMVYAKLLAAASLEPVTRTRTKPRSRRSS